MIANNHSDSLSSFTEPNLNLQKLNFIAMLTIFMANGMNLSTSNPKLQFGSLWVFASYHLWCFGVSSVMFYLISSIFSIPLDMIVSLCRRRPTSKNLSIRAQDLVFDNSYEKEKIQPNEYYYDATQSAPIKVKLTHI